MTRRARLTVTRSGIAIGCAWTPPPPQPGSHAEAIQTALLHAPERRTPADELAAVAALIFTAWVNAWHDSDLRALVIRHRELGYSRSQSIARALWCWLPGGLS